MSGRGESWKARVREEQESIQGIAEYLHLERPEETISELWSEALAVFRVQFETHVVPPSEE